ncbi:MAG: hypothetical protein KAR47_21595, partial [Planctomycetes bacterium]|nr:hypothetical protein [Planctomycetota bacterium]
ILSSFNSGLNSMATLFSLDIYKEIIKKDATDAQMVWAGKIFGAILIVICIIIAPFIGKAEGLYTLMRTIMAVINVPILAVILMGVLSKRAPALAGYVAIPFGMAFFYICHFVLKDDLGFIKVHWLHLAGINLLLMMAVMYLIRLIKPLPVPYELKYTGDVDVTQWKYVWHASWLIIVLLAILYTSLSGLGVIGTGEKLTGNLAIIWGGSAVLLVAIFATLRAKKTKQ